MEDPHVEPYRATATTHRHQKDLETLAGGSTNSSLAHRGGKNRPSKSIEVANVFLSALKKGDASIDVTVCPATGLPKGIFAETPEIAATFSTLRPNVA